MNRADIIALIADKCSVSTSKARETVDTLLNQISGELAAGGKVWLPGIGTFSTSEQPAHQGRNPRTGAVIDIPAGRRLKFATATAMKGALAGAR